MAGWTYVDVVFDKYLDVLSGDGCKANAAGKEQASAYAASIWFQVLSRK